MNDFWSILITICGIILFIYLLPTLLWLLFIIIILITIFVIYQKHKYKKYVDEFDKQMENEQKNYTYTSNTKKDDDVIDVEFSESEEEE